MSALTGPAALAADIGGTFTDIVLERDASRWSHKLLTTHNAPEQALLAGVKLVLDEAGIEASEVSRFVHGTTLATNAVLERKGAETALITTEGFRDILEIGYEGRHDPMDLNIVKQRPLIEREFRFTVQERLSAKGDILRDLDEARLSDIARTLKAKAVESVAIAFLHSYVTPSHERRAREVIQKHIPDAPICLSSEICPEIREFERVSTTCTNAYIQPLVSAYLTRLQNELSALGFHCPLLLMASSGGVIPVSYALEAPIRLIESGPAGGAVLSAAVASELSEDRVLSFDMGGTTAKVCFIQDGAPQVSRLFEVDRAARFMKGSGLPLRVPVVELVEIGAGGGSIASIDALQRIAVGPHSAGSEPGPACYGRGGERPTVTDADLLLGRIDPDRFAGGKIVLDLAASCAAMRSEICTSLKMDPIEAAYGVSEIVDETMANAARAHGAEIGCDLSKHTMVAFGGAAPLHAARIAEKLGVNRIVVPQGAGVGSAVGFLRAPIAYDIAVARPMHLDAYDHEVIEELLMDIDAAAVAVIKSLGNIDGIERQYSADLRYIGQGHELETPFADGKPDPDVLKSEFERIYKDLFGRTLPGAPIEAISWRIRLSKQIEGIVKDSESSTESEPKVNISSRTRCVYSPDNGRSIENPVHERDQLSTISRIVGPALIVEPQTTTIVPPSFSASLHPSGHLILERVPLPEGTS
ncbi:hydantoinase/oxoprolinase family protein [Pelagibius sp.]|uniref:hydantoinase/oxoprolinase family protein n=1 Tax=Pelagibius sp. TaxID=1931238 RepID=UPI003BAFEE44